MAVTVTVPAPVTVYSAATRPRYEAFLANSGKVMLFVSSACAVLFSFVIGAFGSVAEMWAATSKMSSVFMVVSD